MNSNQAQQPVDPKTWYTLRLQEVQLEHEHQSRIQRSLMWWRLAGFAGGILVFFLCLRGRIWWGLLGLGAGWSFFFWAVQKDAELRKKLHYLSALQKMLSRELGCIEGRFPESVWNLAKAEGHHPYAADLDLFGPGSLFHFINRCYTAEGTGVLQKWLLRPSALPELRRRQQAIRELSEMPEWLMELEFSTHGGHFDQKRQVSSLENWLKSSEQQSFASVLRPLPWMALALSTALMFWVFAYHGPSLVLYAWFASLLLLLRFIRKPLMEELASFKQAAPVLNHLATRIHTLHKAGFRSELLQGLQQRACHPQLYRDLRSRRTGGLLRQMDLRQNLLIYALGNLLLLWDVLLVTRVASTRSRLQPLLEPSLLALSELEALCSLATLRFNEPDWCFPELEETPGIWEARDLGHPLLASDRRVGNSLAWNTAPKIVLITGSNMAGKSTFLRAVGINTVLAMCGASCCARFMRCSYWEVFSSMRVADNLQESTSTFRAELHRLTLLLEDLRAGKPLLMLLDEILRGTNSADRHAGTRALIREIRTFGGVALLASHDLELCALEKVFPEQFANYHFDIALQGQSLRFDYILRPGVCRNMNASFLLAQIGLKLEPSDYDSPRKG